MTVADTLNSRPPFWSIVFALMALVIVAYLSGCTTVRTVQVPVVKYECPTIPLTPAPEDLTATLPDNASPDMAFKACGATIDNYAAALKACDSTVEAVNRQSKAK